MNHVPEIRLLGCSRLALNWKMTMTSEFADMTSSSIYFDVVAFLWSSLDSDISFMSVSLLVLKLRQFSFIAIEIEKTSI